MLTKPRRIRCKPYIEWIRHIPCIVCSIRAGYFPEGVLSEPHHVPELGNSAMGSKTSDYRAIPLCRTCHQEYHDKGRETFAEKYDLDYEEIIAGLNKIYKEMEEEIEHQNDSYL